MGRAGEGGGGGEGEAADGRRRRAQASRARIVAAMLKLIRAGEVAPGAAAVAHAAGVSLRTVFRHFDEMESLYREMGDIVEAQVAPALICAYVSADWRGRLREMLERRMRVYDEIMPIKIAASVRRFQSEFLMRDYRRHLRYERQALEAIVPAAVLADAPLMGALELITSFQGWRRLRQDQGLSPDAARAVQLRMLEAVLAGVEG